MEVTYRTEGEYQLPNLVAPELQPVGKYGMLRRSYLRDHKNGIYTGILLSGKLDHHLTEIDRQANDLMDRLIEQMARKQGVTENLKASDQLKWVGLMNNIRASAEEIVMKELIYN